MSLAECAGAGDAPPRTAACCSRSAKIFSKDETSSQRPEKREHSRTAVAPITTACISTRQRGQLRAGRSSAATRAAAVPQRGQCFVPLNIMPKHDGHDTAASSELQYWHCGASLETAAPQLGQFRVSARMPRILSGEASWTIGLSLCDAELTTPKGN